MGQTLHSSARVGVLIAQLGTPEAPTRRSMHAYLAEFLSDPRVLDVAPLKRQLILRLLVLPWRPARLAARYGRIWTAAGSPLLAHSQAQVSGLQERLGSVCQVVLGMRYGRPGLTAAVRALQTAGIQRILVFPMFPQFSSSTTGSVYDGAAQAANGRRCPLFFEHRRAMPSLRFVPPYYDDPAYIEALRTIITEDLTAWGASPEHFLFSFHGLPQRYVDEGDPYRDQCETTTRLLVAALGLAPGAWDLGFQSRFGREPWLAPDTGELLVTRARAGISRLAVVCPGFTADGLETLDELGAQGRGRFLQAGGRDLRLVPCLNAHSSWVDAMAAIVRRETSGWIDWERDVGSVVRG